MDKLKQKIGIIGGGQLGKMMILEAKKMGFTVAVLDPGEKCPAHSLADELIVADFNDKQAIQRLAAMCDVLTYEIEHIDVTTLLSLAANGHKIYPTPESLVIIQNKWMQKKRLKECGLPVPDFMKVESVSDLEKAGELFGYPFLLKACTGGYDGRGNLVVHTKEETKAAFTAFGVEDKAVPLMAERFIRFQKEISVLSCRGIDGTIQVYPVAENEHSDNILLFTKVPAAINPADTQQAMDIAKQTMEVFDGVGMFCVELFVLEGGGVLINEVAPRPHNSGHYSIEACVTSQFENHIRAIAGLPLGSSALLAPAVMGNLLGEKEGLPVVTGVDEALQIDGLSLHIYGKEKSQPKRKMGHFTITAHTLSDACEKAEKAACCLRI